MGAMGINFFVKDDGLPCVVWNQYPGMFQSHNGPLVGGKWKTIEIALNRDQNGRLYLHRAEWKPARAAYNETIHPNLLEKLIARVQGERLQPEIQNHPAVPATPIAETVVTFWADELVSFALSGASRFEYNPNDPKRSARYANGSVAMIPARLLADLGHGKTVEVARHYDTNDQELGNLRAELTRVFVHQEGWQPPQAFPRPFPAATTPAHAAPGARPGSIEDDII